jgi:hypothetical protein
MRSVAAVLCVLVLPTIIFSQDHVIAPPREIPKLAAAATVERELMFAGGVVLRIGVDSMTDRQTCTLSLTSDDVWIDTSGLAAVIATGADVDYKRPALLRIGSAPPYPLIVPRQARRIVIPPRRSPGFVRALYTQQPIRLRFTEWPDGGRFDDLIKFGDFASAYDRGVVLCGWPKIRAAAVHPKPEPSADSRPAAAVKIAPPPGP